MKSRQALLITYLSAISLTSIANNNKIEFKDDSGTRYVRSRIAGEIDLMNIARTSCFEDLWIYSFGKWYDIGVNEGTATVDQDENELNRVLSETRGPVYEYHTHPHDWCPLRDQDGISLEAISMTDIISHVALSEKIRPQRRRLFSKAIDEHGVWSYTVTRRLRERLLSDTESFSVELAGRSLYSGTTDLFNVPHRLFYNKLNRYLRNQRRNGVLVSYRRLRL